LKKQQKNIGNLKIFQTLITVNNRRLKNFQINNPHLTDVQITKGVPEEHIPSKELVNKRIVTKRFIEYRQTYPKGSVGNLYSIFNFLKKCSEEEIFILVFEDDAIIHPNLYEFIIYSWETIKVKDYICFGTNTDSFLQFLDPQNNLSFISFEDSFKYPNINQIRNYFKLYNYKKINLKKIILGFGTSCFLVSPKGAKKILNLLFPLDLIPINSIAHSKIIYTCSFDRGLNNIFNNLDAYLAYPFMSISPNDNNKDIPSTDS